MRDSRSLIQIWKQSVRQVVFLEVDPDDEMTVYEVAKRVGASYPWVIRNLDPVLRPILQQRGTKQTTRIYSRRVLDAFWDTIPRPGKRGRPLKPETFPDEIAWWSLWSVHSSGCRGRELLNFITFERFIELCQQNCTYCGREPELRTLGKRRVFANGIDRVDSDHGYIEGNIVPCCKQCNRMKGAMPVGEFLDQVLRIARFQIR